VRRTLLAGLALLALACTTPPNPGPNGPGGAGGSSPSPVHPASCTDAASHAETVCHGAGALTAQVCQGASTWDPGYIPCVMAATACFNCDATARAAAAKH
jgi:hypothetical protein